MDVRRLRAMAVRGSLSSPASLEDALARLEFVQFDPIRRPARAQDLILHQRVRGYRAGDLAREYARLDLEEDMLHVYGAMTTRVWRLLHPRPDREGREYEPGGLAAEVLEFVRANGRTHPRDLDASFGRTQAVNAWGGMSAAATRALERLHYHGFVRVAGREKGVKLYVASEPPSHDLSPDERLRRLALVAARLLAPVSDTSLGGVVAKLRRAARGSARPRAVVDELVGSGQLEAAVVDGIRYVWPPALAADASRGGLRRVRLLAPFDPVVWDRARFEHLWGWPYRFEAYTPAPKRRFGYYALPLLVGDRVLGWATCELDSGRLSLDVQTVGRRPAGTAFRDGVERERERLETMVAGR